MVPAIDPRLIARISHKQDVIDAEKNIVRLHVYGQAFNNVELKFLGIGYKFKEDRKACQIGIRSDRWCNL